MDITGEYRILAPRQTVWEALNNPDVLRASIPGCEELQAVSPTEYAAKVKAKVGAVQAKFGGKVTLSDIVPPESYTISGQGQGGVAGFAKGSARVTLTEDGGGATILRYDAKADVGGKIAAVGSRLIQGVAAKTADDFFTAFAAIVAGPQAAPTTPTAEAVVTAPAAAPKAERGAIFWLLLGIAIGVAATAIGTLLG